MPGAHIHGSTAVVVSAVSYEVLVVYLSCSLSKATLAAPCMLPAAQRSAFVNSSTSSTTNIPVHVVRVVGSTKSPLPPIPGILYGVIRRTRYLECAAQGHAGTQASPGPRVSDRSNLYLVPGRCFIGTEKNIYTSTRCVQNVELRLVCAYLRAAVTRKRFVTAAACVYLEIDLPQVLNRGLHLDLEVLQWTKLVEVRGAPN